MIEIQDREGGFVVRVRVQPRAARDGLAGERDGALVVRLTAPPVEGHANVALTRLLARTLGLPAAAVSILRGTRGRDKLLYVSGLGATALRERLRS